MWRLSAIFLKVGFLSFGGGWSVVGVLKNELVGNGILTPEEFTKAVSIAQVTPGPVAINLATYTGYKDYGLFGAVLNTLSFLAAPIAIVLAVFLLGSRAKIDKERWAGALKGTCTVMVFVTLLSLLRNHLDLWTVLLSIGAFFMTLRKVHPLLIVFGCGALGVLFSL